MKWDLPGPGCIGDLPANWVSKTHLTRWQVMPLTGSPTHAVHQASAETLVAPLGTTAVRPGAPFALRHSVSCSLFLKHLDGFSSTTVTKTQKVVLSLVLGRDFIPRSSGVTWQESLPFTQERLVLVSSKTGFTCELFLFIFLSSLSSSLYSSPVIWIVLLSAKPLDWYKSKTLSR